MSRLSLVLVLLVLTVLSEREAVPLFGLVTPLITAGANKSSVLTLFVANQLQNKIDLVDQLAALFPIVSTSTNVTVSSPVAAPVASPVIG